MLIFFLPRETKSHLETQTTSLIESKLVTCFTSQCVFFLIFICGLRSPWQPTSTTYWHQRLVSSISRYIPCSRELGLYYSEMKLGFTNLAHSEANCTGFKSIRQSTTGIPITSNDTPVYWKRNRESMVTFSSSEANSIALLTEAKKLTQIFRLCWEVQF